MENRLVVTGGRGGAVGKISQGSQKVKLSVIALIHPGDVIYSRGTTVNITGLDI